MAGGLSAKNETFCRLIVEGVNATDAYNQAFPGSRQSNTARKSGCLLLAKPEIQARITALRNIAAETTATTLTSMSADFDKAIQFAYDEKKPSAVVQGLVAKAKLLGLFVEKKDIQIGMRFEDAQRNLAHFMEKYAKFAKGPK